MRRFVILSLLIVAGTGFILLSLMQPIVGTRTDFSIYNTRWNGGSEFAKDIYDTGSLQPTFNLNLLGGDVDVSHRSFAEFSPSGDKTVIIAGPDRGFSSQEGAWLRAFLADGGRLLLADDFGTGNQVLEAIESESRFHGGLVRDISYSKAPEFVLTTNLRPHSLTQGVQEIILDYATALQPGPAALELAYTFTSSWIDANDDLIRNPNEPTGPFPILALEKSGAGLVMLASDPSLFINGQRELADNELLIQHIVAWVTEDGRKVLIDESHRDYPDPVKVAGFRMQDLPASWRVPLALLGGAIFVAFTQPQIWRWVRIDAARGLLDRWFREPEPEPRDLVAEVLARHPDWDESTLKALSRDWIRP